MHVDLGEARRRRARRAASRAVKKRRWSARGSKCASSACRAARARRPTTRPWYGVVTQRAARPSAARAGPLRGARRRRRRARAPRPPRRRRPRPRRAAAAPPSATRRASRPGTRARARRSASSATSTATTSHPAAARSAAKAPSPAPRSSTRSPGVHVLQQERAARARTARAARPRAPPATPPRARAPPGATVSHDAAHYAPRGVNLLAVNAVDVPGEPELRLLDALRRLRDQGWEPTISTPGEGPARPTIGFPWVHLDVGGLGQGEGARAVASWPRALRLAQRFDVVLPQLDRLRPPAARAARHARRPARPRPRRPHTAPLAPGRRRPRRQHRDRAAPRRAPGARPGARRRTMTRRPGGVRRAARGADHAVAGVHRTTPALAHAAPTRQDPTRLRLRWTPLARLCQSADAPQTIKTPARCPHGRQRPSSTSAEWR